MCSFLIRSLLAVRCTCNWIKFPYLFFRGRALNTATDSSDRKYIKKHLCNEPTIYFTLVTFSFHLAGTKQSNHDTRFALQIDVKKRWKECVIVCRCYGNLYFRFSSTLTSLTWWRRRRRERREAKIFLNYLAHSSTE